MKIKWFGQSFFEITSDLGVKIVTDPFGEDLGYKVPELKADIVTVSHDHNDHNKINNIEGKFECLIGEEKYNLDDVEVKGILSSHGHLLGENIIFKFLVDNISICHLGDLGSELNSNQIKSLGNIDVLLIPVGGGGRVLNAKKAMKLVDIIKPKIVIPMHYKTEKLSKRFFTFSKVDKFLELSNGKMIGKQEIEINEDNIDSLKGTIVLDYE